MPGGRAAWGVLSFSDFSLDKQRKVTGSQQRAELATLQKSNKSSNTGLPPSVQHSDVVSEDHQRTFNVARPTSTSTTLMIQNRTITRGSGQPLSSK